MKIFFKIVLLSLGLLSIFIQSISAINFGSVINILENIETGEVKMIVKGLPTNETELIQREIDNVSFENHVGKMAFEKWKGTCYYNDTHDRNTIKEGNCEGIDFYDISIPLITIDDLSYNDIENLYKNIFSDYIYFLIIGIPFNFFVFFGIIHALVGNKLKRYQYLLLSIIFTIILDGILLFPGLSFIQLFSVMFGIVPYFMFILIPKSIFFIYGIIIYRRYMKILKESTPIKL